MDSKLEIFIGIMERSIKYEDGLQIVEANFQVNLDA